MLGYPPGEDPPPPRSSRPPQEQIPPVSRAPSPPGAVHAGRYGQQARVVRILLGCILVIYYCPKQSCEGYVFTGVCLSTVGGCLLPGSTWSQGGVCSQRGRGVCSQRGRGVCSRGVVSQHALRQTPPPRETATAADGTHPTGMHSCF